MKLIATFYQTSDDYDSDEVRWVDEDHNPHGFGFMSKKTGIIHIRYCPVCGGENYMSQQVCVGCGFSPNPKGKDARKRSVHSPSRAESSGDLPKPELKR